MILTGFGHAQGQGASNIYRPELLFQTCLTNRCEDPFRITTPTELVTPSKELVTTLLIRFESIPKTCDELKAALESELPRKLLILPLDWNVLKVNKVAAQVFECASSCSPVDITCILRAAYFNCTKRKNVFGEMKSAEIRQAY